MRSADKVYLQGVPQKPSRLHLQVGRCRSLKAPDGGRRGVLRQRGGQRGEVWLATEVGGGIQGYGYE